MENLPALAANGADPGCTDRVARSASDTAVGRVQRASAAAHAIRHLQDRPPPRLKPGQPQNRAPNQPTRLPAHRRRAHRFESGVDVNVIRGWLGHADLSTTNRYAEINTNAKQAALRATEPRAYSEGYPINARWRTDQAPFNWLASL